jgi:hypothetical protein
MKKNDTVHISAANARKAYNGAPNEVKKVLADLIGTEVLNADITERVKTYEDACFELGLDPEEELPYPNPVNDRQVRANGRAEADIIADALCEAWVPDHTNQSQPKYEVRAVMQASGRGFAFSVTDNWFTYSGVGARQFPNSKIAEYFFTQFINIHEKYLPKCKK